MQVISVEELKSRKEAGNLPQLLDVREPGEHEEFNIGGLLFPLGRIQAMETEDLDQWKEEEIICYCRSGNRSGQACLFLEMAGFKNVKNLSGGMMAWQNKFGNLK
jgi:rhodanese-related sulfurtransferase